MDPRANHSSSDLERLATKLADLERRVSALELKEKKPASETALLAAGLPIGGRKREVPEARRRACEFHCNSRRSHQHLLHGHHAALLLFAAF